VSADKKALQQMLPKKTRDWGEESPTSALFKKKNSLLSDKAKLAQRIDGDLKISVHTAFANSML
jgi:hypothetical protein